MGTPTVAYPDNQRKARLHYETLPDLVSSHILEGCGHWGRQERAEIVNRLLVD